MIVAAGLFDILIGVFHLTFEPLFGWRSDLARLRPVNAGIMRALNLCLTWLFLFLGWMLMTRADEIATTGLGRTLLLGLAILWWSRLIEQPVFFGTRRASIAFGLVVLAGALLHTIPLVG